MLAVVEPASALSCLRIEPLEAYKSAARSDDSFVVVHGRLDFDRSKMPGAEQTDSMVPRPETTRLTAQVEGLFLDESGFRSRFGRLIDLKVQCVGPWCGLVGNGKRHLMFLRQVGPKYELLVNACPAWLFADPDRRVLNRIETCHAAGPRCWKTTD